jgi:hypothetical protein
VLLDVWDWAGGGVSAAWVDDRTSSQTVRPIAAAATTTATSQRLARST